MIGVHLIIGLVLLVLDRVEGFGDMDSWLGSVSLLLFRILFSIVYAGDLHGWSKLCIRRIFATLEMVLLPSIMSLCVQIDCHDNALVLELMLLSFSSFRHIISTCLCLSV